MRSNSGPSPVRSNRERQSRGNQQTVDWTRFVWSERLVVEMNDEDGGVVYWMKRIGRTVSRVRLTERNRKMISQVKWCFCRCVSGIQWFSQLFTAFLPAAEAVARDVDDLCMSTYHSVCRRGISPDKSLCDPLTSIHHITTISISSRLVSHTADTSQWEMARTFTSWLLITDFMLYSCV